jgi:hypothetical protein
VPIAFETGNDICPRIAAHFQGHVVPLPANAASAVLTKCKSMVVHWREDGRRRLPVPSHLTPDSRRTISPAPKSGRAKKSQNFRAFKFLRAARAASQSAFSASTLPPARNDSLPLDEGEDARSIGRAVRAERRLCGRARRAPERIGGRGYGVCGYLAHYQRLLNTTAVVVPAPSIAPEGEVEAEPVEQRPVAVKFLPGSGIAE